MNTSASPTDPASASRESVRLREDLYAFLGQYQLRLEGPLDDDTSLIAAGVLDSLALFNLVLWVEKQIGQSVNPTSTDLAREWDTVRLILRFIEGSASRGTRGDAAGISRGSGRRTRALRIVEYSSEYREAIASLQTQLWSPDAERNRKYLEWKYERNPYGNEPRIYLALEGDEVLAMRGFYPSYWEIGPQPRRRVILVADDLLVRDDHRGRGLVNYLMQAAYHDLERRGIDYLLNLSGSPFTVESSIATGWKSAGALNPMDRCSRSQRRRNQLRRMLARTPLMWRYAASPFLSSNAERNPFARLDRLPEVLHSKDGMPVHVSRRALPTEMTSLVRRIGHDHRIRHVRDQTYFEWRLKNPLHDYRFFYVGKPELDGYMVLKRTIGNGGVSPRVSIVDLEAVDQRTRDVLLQCGTRQDLFEELFVWSATLPKESQEALSIAGFRPLDQSPLGQGNRKILVRPTDDTRLTEDWHIDGIRILESANWDMRMIYSMAG